jgi:cytochrome P450
MSELPEATRRHFQNPYASYEIARAQRLFKDARGIWYAARFEDVDEILRDRRFGKKALPGTEHRLPIAQRLDQADRLAILNVDPPDHTRIRGLLTRAFSASRVEAMRPSIAALVDGILDRQAPRRAMEIMKDFAFPIPATVISDMLGIPAADRERFAELSRAIIAFGTGVPPGADAATEAEFRTRAREATASFDAYLIELLDAKRRTQTDDLATALLKAEDEGGRLTAAEVIQNVRLLFMAGHETTVNLIGNAIVALFKHPDQLARLKADPELMPGAVEEFLRYDSSVQQLPRVAQADVEIGGQTILAGEMVVCLLGAANRDPNVYPDAERLDIERTFVRSKSFGGGIHFCLGAQLARIETEIALTKLFARLPNLEITHLDAVAYPINPFFRGPLRLDARWE